MRLTLVRHATLLLELGGRRVLVDPMLGDAGAYPPIENTPNPVRNPLVPLPAVPLEPLDALVVTHLHNDHWDAAARERLPKGLPVLTQPESAQAIREAGFADVRPVEDEAEWEGIRIARTGGRHGHGALERHRPDVAVVNAGAARFVGSEPITMDADDVRHVVAAGPRVVAVHLEAINHCLLTRAELGAAVPEALVPADGETLDL